MKLAVDNSSITKRNNIAFKGHSAVTSPRNNVEHHFYLPYDSSKYKATLELCSFQDVNGRWKKIEGEEPQYFPLPPEGVKVSEDLLYTEDGTATGYRFVLTHKNSQGQKVYKIDAGLQTNPYTSEAEGTYSLLLPNRAVLTVNGLTKQVMPDICFPGYKINGYNNIGFDAAARQRALNSVRTHGNKLGGNFAGIIKMLPTWKKEGYTKIVGTPFTRDEVSSHLYWTENPYQIASTLGNIEDFKFLQRELFKNGINFIADGALVNQGLQGAMFKDVLKHGTSSPFFHWFKAPGLLSSDLKLGVIPSKKEARENFRFRIVNAPYKLVEKNGKTSLENNPNYDKKKLSYIQLYDKRLVSSSELNSNELLTTYSKTNTNNAYDITNHDDVTQLLAFEIEPDNFKKHIKQLQRTIPQEKQTFKNPNFVEGLLKFDNFRLTTKDKGGVDLWDGNMDIAKLNFYTGNTDQAYIEKFTDPTEKRAKLKEMNQSIYQVQDFALKSAKYWTKLVADTQIEYAANTIKGTNGTVSSYKEAINKAIKNGELPDTAANINDATLRNILKGKYDFPKLNIEPHLTLKQYYIQSQIMEEPFEQIELSPDLTAVLASPYITKRANNEEDIFTPRHELYIQRSIGKNNGTDKYTRVYNKADGLMTKEMTEFTTTILNQIETKMAKSGNKEKLFEQDRVTEFGIYAISALMPDIFKYAVVKGLNPDAKIKYDTKNSIVDYSEANLKDISLKSIGVVSGTNDVEKEASDVIDKLSNGVTKITAQDKEDLVDTLLPRIKDLKPNDYKVANAIINETGSGLGWRIDAAKDIANIDAIRTGNDNNEEAFSAVVDFWKKFNDVIKAENQHAFTTAEITDLGQVIDDPNGEYENYVKAEAKFIARSGLNNTANYMFFYSLLRDMFAQSAEDGQTKDEFSKIEKLHEKLVIGWDKDKPDKDKICHGFLYEYPDDSIANSYTFVGNHDKPRVLHVLALDMDLFHTNFVENPNNFKNYKERAGRVLNVSPDELDVYKLSGKAIAMGERLLGAFESSGAILNDTNYNNASDEDKKNSDILKDSIAALASGNFKDKEFNADAFGTRDFRHAIKHVFEEAQYLGYKTSPEKQKEFTNKALKNILEPAMDKMETIYKMLVTLPGSPTDFVGDKEGSSGYETKSNNDYQQNRNVVPFEWVSKIIGDDNISSKDNQDFVNNYYNRMNEIGKLRSKKELSALTTGSTIALPVQYGHLPNQDNNDIPVTATYRYDNKGSEVICLYTTSGATNDPWHPMDRKCIDLDRIYLESPNWKEGIKGGLKPGTIFKNANGKGTYVVTQDKTTGAYVLENQDKAYKVSILPEDKNTTVLYKEKPKAYTPTLIYPNMTY